MKIRQFLSALALVFVANQVSAQGVPIIFAVNEGVTYRVNPGATVDRFRDVSDDLSKLLKRPVKIQAVSDYKELAAGLSEQLYDLAYVHPAHHSIRAMTKSGYSLVALTKGYTDYRASFMVRGDSPLKTLVDLKTVKVGAPAEDSITSVMLRATLTEAFGQQLPQITYVKMQDAVPFMVEHGLAATGVTASRAVLKEWQEHGGKVLFTSKPVPIKHMIASSKLTDAQRSLLTNYFVGLEQTPEGKKRLEALNVSGFVEFDQRALSAIGKWLGL